MEKQIKIPIVVHYDDDLTYTVFYNDNKVTTVRGADRTRNIVFTGYPKTIEDALYDIVYNIVENWSEESDSIIFLTPVSTSDTVLQELCTVAFAVITKNDTIVYNVMSAHHTTTGVSNKKDINKDITCAILSHLRSVLEEADEENCAGK